MKSIIRLFAISALACMVGNVNAQLETCLSSFSAALAAALKEKTTSGGKFKDPSNKVCLAAQWDLLPEESDHQKEVKQSLKENYRSVFNTYPDSIDLSHMTQYVNLDTICKQAQENLKNQYDILARQNKKLEFEQKKASQQSSVHQGSLSTLSAAINDFSLNFKKLAKALGESQDSHLQGSTIDPRDAAKNLLKARDSYYQALENLHDTAIALNLHVDLSNSFLDTIINGEINTHVKQGELPASLGTVPTEATTETPGAVK